MLKIWQYFKGLCLWFIHTRQHGVESIEVGSLRSKLSDSNVIMMSLVDKFTLLEKRPSQVELAIQRPSRGGEPLSNDDELYLWRPPRGSELLSMFVTCFYRVLILRCAFPYLDCLSFIDSFFCSLLCSSGRHSALSARSSREAYSCSNHQRQRLWQVWWVSHLTNTVLGDLSLYTVLKLSFIFRISCANYADIVDPFQRLHTFAFSFSMLSSAT